MGNGEWGMGNGEWGMGQTGHLSLGLMTDDYRFDFAQGKITTDNCQLTTDN